jgi:hypothetical protein
MYIPEPKINNPWPMLVHIVYHLLIPLKGWKQRTSFNYVLDMLVGWSAGYILGWKITMLLKSKTSSTYHVLKIYLRIGLSCKMNSFDTLHSEMHHGFSILFYFWREVKGEASKGPNGFFLKTSTKLAKFLWNVFQLCRFKQ